jgi:hypothetical protein
VAAFQPQATFTDAIARGQSGARVLRVFQPAYANTYHGSYRLLALFRRNSDCDRNARPLTADNFRALIIITLTRWQAAVRLRSEPRNSRLFSLS